MPRFLSFDLETCKILPADAGEDLLRYRPLGLSCAAAVASDIAGPIAWHGRDALGQPTSQVSPEEAAAVVASLEQFRSDGYTIVTWNGLGFDFVVLADASGLSDRCAALALDHVDMLFHFVCARGHFVSLQKVAEGMGMKGKTEGVTGADAPKLWAAGRYDQVLEYCRQDSRTTLEIADAAEQQGRLSWLTRRGTRDHFPLPNGWLSVREAQKLPLPDTSWMRDPPTRDSFFRWFPKETVR